jgi:hypothetical protein
LKSLAGCGFRKKRLQNLDDKVVRGQNLDNKGLTAILSMTPGTACALTIFYVLLGEHKVRCHTTGAMAVDFRVDRPPETAGRVAM